MLDQFKILQSEMFNQEKKLADTEFPGESGGGLVRVVLNGRGHLVESHCDLPAILAGNIDGSMLGDLIVAAYQDARKKVDDAATESLSSMTNNMNFDFVKRFMPK
jgi:DNA-binding protein YbaB